ncbi:MAG: dihydroneopterin aldolase [Bacteroidales bacterium]|jgi:dihydroneopterin aldolase|nr:dihydroneopterin aldolase [Bacteroidales bacterium]MDD2824920.1 dihydroneopterin aldolase [Bacteroidales bacterium]MDD3100087.1 dihydroneopterin aldolase [Bacteroidales bacterium]MDD3639013.1 dihydroneopterin aldolase [Bacteroidales bacterium]MDD3943578.1 dihydroneopterin aldolase [Bacteroidales bacterium]
MATITLNDMKFYAHHGCFDEERLIGTRFLVDVELETVSCPAVLTDELEDAIDYSKVYRVVAAEMAVPSRLLEHVAGRIIRSLTRAFPVSDCRVKVSKLAPALGGETGKASVTLTMKDLPYE